MKNETGGKGGVEHKTLDMRGQHNTYVSSLCGEWMDGWTDGWMDEWIYGWMDGWMDGGTDG
jgi:hypothetical protein